MRLLRSQGSDKSSVMLFKILSWACASFGKAGENRGLPSPAGLVRILMNVEP